MNVDNVSRDDWILAGLAILLVIALIAFPWFDVTIGPFSNTFSATGAPDGFLGVIGLLAALALIVDLGIERLSPQTRIPAVGSRANTRLLLAALAAVCVVLKFILHIHFSGIVSFAWGFYADVIITAALIYYAFLANASAVPTFGGTGTRGPGAGPPPPSPPPGAPPAGGAGAPPAGGTPGVGGSPGPGGAPGGGTGAGGTGAGGSTPPPPGP